LQKGADPLRLSPGLLLSGKGIEVSVDTSEFGTFAPDLHAALLIGARIPDIA
jgi:hypothetical protein